LKNVRVIEWLKKATGEAKFITSHCQGAFARQGRSARQQAGDDLPTNTNDLQKQYPACRVQGDRRVVVDGNLITSPGGLASYEASLYVVEQLFERTKS
jgi:transcriptional regulator GlxA family with amidase domain